MSSSTNPLLEPSPLPFGYPPFDRIQTDHYLPAFEIAMAAHLAEVEAIVSNPEAPTFENTLEALEKAGQQLTRVQAVFSNMALCNTSDALKQIEQDMAPKLAAHRDAIALNPGLFRRIVALHEKKDTLGLVGESARLLWRYHRDFERAGALLPEAAQTQLKVINGEVATLETKISQAILNEMNDSAVWFGAESELEGLSSDQITAAKANAEAVAVDKRQGAYLVKLLNTTGQPCLDSLKVRASRKKILDASLARGSRGGPHDTRGLLANLVRLRTERAHLLGYASHAAFQLAEETIGDVSKVNGLLGKLAPAAVANARKEASKMQELADEEQKAAGQPSFTIAAYDWDFYAEKVRLRDFSFDEGLLKPYLELHRVVKDGVLYAATQLYGLQFVRRHDLPVYHPSVEVYDVFEEDGKTQVALFIMDYYARDSKKGGAWMSDYVSQSALLGNHVPIIANHLNVTAPPSPDQPVLLTFDEVRTLFHEFGHGLHGMLSKVHFPRFSGTNVPTDFVEFPSQVNEMWALFPDVLNHYARHHATGEPMPAELVAKAMTVEQFNQGYRTTEYLAAALLDQAFHQLNDPSQVPASDEAVVEFEQRALTAVGLTYEAVPPRYRSAYFAHIFSCDSYSAKYYAYLWSEVLDSDAVEWFKENGGLKRASGQRMRDCVLSKGGSEDSLTLFQRLIGKEPYLEPLLRKRGLLAAM